VLLPYIHPEALDKNVCLFSGFHIEFKSLKYVECIKMSTSAISRPSPKQLLCSEINECTSDQEGLWSSSFSRRDFAHSLFQYPAMMVPSVQSKIIDLILNAQPTITNMVDPFMGAGTTINAAMTHGLDCYGQDINPLALLVTQARTEVGWKNGDLESALIDIVTHANQDISMLNEANFSNFGKWFASQTIIELSRLRRAIRKIKQVEIRRFYWVILAETVRVSSNDRTTTFKLHSRPIEEIINRRINVFQVFRDLAQKGIRDIFLFKQNLEKCNRLNNGAYKGHVHLFLGDTKKQVCAWQNDSVPMFDLLITSPPYGDNISTITYGQHSYLPLQWIDLDDIDPQVAAGSYLRTTQEIDRRSLGGRSNINGLNQSIKYLCDQSPFLQNVFAALESHPIDRSARVAAFYGDIIITLDNLLPSVKPGGFMVWTLGNRKVGGKEIPTDKIFTDLLMSRQSEFVCEISREIRNKRMPHKNNFSTTMKYEKILIFQKRGGE